MAADVAELMSAVSNGNVSCIKLTSARYLLTGMVAVQPVRSIVIMADLPNGQLAELNAQQQSRVLGLGGVTTLLRLNITGGRDTKGAGGLLSVREWWAGVCVCVCVCVCV